MTDIKNISHNQSIQMSVTREPPAGETSTMNECKYELGEIVEYLMGGMAEARRDELQAHVDAGCSQCDNRIESLGGFI